MDPRDTSFSLAQPVSMGSEMPEETPADIDEPPETNQHINFWLPDKPPTHSPYAKAVPPAYMRRESLLTRQLHSETEHSEEERIISPVRGLSTVSVWSNPSTVSTAELTSDDGHSMPSPGISPALPPTTNNSTIPVVAKPLNEPKILGLESVAIKDPVEAGLGRKRCITFACGKKDKVETLYQRDTHKGIILSAPLELTLNKGSNNTITVGGLWNGFDVKGADLDRIVVYPPEPKDSY